MKRWITVLTMVMVCSVAVRGEDPVYFADANLKAKVEAMLRVTDPTPSDMLSLTYLYPSNEEISDLTGLQYATNLKELWAHYNQISDLSPLGGLTNLVELYLSYNQISDLSPLAGLTNLVELTLGNNQISDLSPLAGLTNLDWLALHNNQISDLSPLAGLTNLRTLYLWENQISDLSPLAGLTNLETLVLYTNQISDLSPLAGLTDLDTLVLHTNQISDISPLAGLTNLGWVYLCGNPLNQEAREIYIPQMLANGIHVDYFDCTSLPDVVGMTESEAEAALTAAGFVVGTKWWTISDEPGGTVIDQDPPAGERAPAGSPVDLTLSQDKDGGGDEPDPEPTTSPLPVALAHWKLDESSGTTAHDSSGNNRDGTLHGNPAWMPTGGRLGGALMFDGLDDYVLMPDWAICDSESVSVAAWVKPDRVDEFMRIVRNQSTFALYVRPGGVLVSDVIPASYGGRTHINLRFGPISAGEWCHAAFTWDAPSGQWRCYLNGSEDAFKDEQDNNPLAPLYSSPAFLIGAGGTQNSLFDGLIDDVRIYDVALSKDQMAAVMAGHVAPEPPPGMIGYWPGDGNADDLAGEDDGTLMNGATFAPGVVGQAFSLDGTNDYVRIPHAPELSPESVTVEAWVKPDRVNKWMRVFCSQLSYQLNLSNKGQIASLIKPMSRGGASYLTLGGGNVPANEWSYLACTYDAPTGHWRLYVDAVQVAFDELGANNPLLPNTEDLRIGAIYSDAAYFDGLIDEVALYDRALSAQEILDLYQALGE